MSTASDSVAPVGVVDADEFMIEFVGVDGEVRCEPLARCGGVRFEDVAPARAFPMFKGQRNFPGRWWSSTVGRHVGYESWLERDHVMLLDFDPAVVGIASQPFGCPGRRRVGCAGICRTTSSASRTAVGW
ncbi:hypothetical protein [Micromonospora inyonensis]|uniref:hypothetical protein n=1 Tax=Micromonospora inyonensis TaxID=47866 RepID=UPI001FDF640F|nr:hypothetical protein [Micromonospora inyonensis]